MNRMNRLSRAGGMLLVVASAAHGQSFVNWESPHVSPLDVTPDGTKLLAVNTADNRQADAENLPLEVAAEPNDAVAVDVAEL